MICKEDGADFVHIDIADMEKLITVIKNTKNMFKNNGNQKMDAPAFQITGNSNNKKQHKSSSKIEFADTDISSDILTEPAKEEESSNKKYKLCKNCALILNAISEKRPGLELS
jgi:hypothetical protein